MGGISGSLKSCGADVVELTGFEVKIVWKLHRRGKYGGSHTPVENTIKGFRKDHRGEASGAVDKLVRKGILLSKPTRYGLEISLNRDLVALIHQVCDWHEAHVDEMEDRDDYEFP